MHGSAPTTLLLRFYDVLIGSLELAGVENHRLRTLDVQAMQAMLDFELRMRRRDGGARRRRSAARGSRSTKTRAGTTSSTRNDVVNEDYDVDVEDDDVEDDNVEDDIVDLTVENAGEEDMEDDGVGDSLAGAAGARAAGALDAAAGQPGGGGGQRARARALARRRRGWPATQRRDTNEDARRGGRPRQPSRARAGDPACDRGRGAAAAGNAGRPGDAAPPPPVLPRAAQEAPRRALPVERRSFAVRVRPQGRARRGRRREEARRALAVADLSAWAARVAMIAVIAPPARERRFARLKLRRG